MAAKPLGQLYKVFFLYTNPDSLLENNADCVCADAVLAAVRRGRQHRATA
jgi:hypothetical protein